MFLKEKLIMINIVKRIVKYMGKLLWSLLGIIYYPIYVLCWILHIVARFMLAISYFGLLDRQRAKNVFKSLFRYE